MSHRSNPLGLPEHTAESLARLNYYQFLGLTEASSTRAIQRALHRDRWPWHLVDEEARQVATQMKIEAFGVLSEPASRAEYDRTQGFTAGHLASVIGDDKSWWAIAWVAAWSVVALLFFVSGPDFAARTIGSWFAPGFREIARYNAPIAGCLTCRGYYSREFLSSSGVFHWFLNSVFTWAVFPAISLLCGMMLRTAAARASGFVVAVSRYRANDTLARAACLVMVAVLPFASFVTLLATAPPGVYVPGELFI